MYLPRTYISYTIILGTHKRHPQRLHSYLFILINTSANSSYINTSTFLYPKTLIQ